MSLVALAATDLRRILEDEAGFAVEIAVTDPDGNTANLKGFQTDIGLTIDPETGQAVTGRKASVALSILALAEAGLAVPRTIHDKAKKPWFVQFAAPTGGAQLFKVLEAIPDKLGIVVCLLEAHKRVAPAPALETFDDTFDETFG